ncbi:MAG: hypothetical protein K2Y05_07265, partial [Hyphomicrobiaceae bacterium]|nr:hypothetical protein [Hyphomicrobiaceae bacterium]
MSDLRMPVDKGGAMPNRASVDLTLDQIDYIADLISELREMAQGARIETLAALLALAQAEAAREAARLRPR